LAESYLYLAGLYAQLAKPAQGLEKVRQFVYLEPKRPEGHFYLAIFQHALGRRNRASQACYTLLNLLEGVAAYTQFEHLDGMTAVKLRQTARELLAALE
jgi:hypothetical protein